MAEATRQQIQKAIDTLKAGGVVVFPTETSYGLGADATNRQAVRRVMAIKGRSESKPPPVMVADLKMAWEHGIFCQRLRALAKQFWPGPLNIIVPKKKNSLILIGQGEVALRVSGSAVARELVRKLGRPIVATSANLAGAPACYSMAAWRKQTAGRALQPDYILDVGALPRNPASTIIKKQNGKIIVVRQGAIQLPEKYV
ncbi:threonylcarbamoyl-AMP synthase [Patescibacteria group bacterium]|nr:threonylcarbamoyl-AMP synthase [Patescibacteria group bacterium]MBU1705263.1 threonylcarbamoyl-AMP synthase [Patescibacteria group bacterium]